MPDEFIAPSWVLAYYLGVKTKYPSKASIKRSGKTVPFFIQEEYLLACMDFQITKGKPHGIAADVKDLIRNCNPVHPEAIRAAYSMMGMKPKSPIFDYEHLQPLGVSYQPRLMNKVIGVPSISVNGFVIRGDEYQPGHMPPARAQLVCTRQKIHDACLR